MSSEPRDQYLAVCDELQRVVAERDALRARVTKLEEEFYFQASLTKELMPYQERAVKAEADLAAAQKECDDALAAVDSNWVTHQQIVVLQQDLEAARALLRKAYIHVRYADTKPDAELERQIFDAALKDKP